MDIDEILNKLITKKITIAKAKMLLSLYNIEYIGNTIKFDIGRRNRKYIPEVILAEKKNIFEIKKTIDNVIKKTDRLLISRLNRKDYNKIITYSKKKNLKIKTGKNATTILIYRNIINLDKGKIGIISAGTSDVGIAEEARLMCEAMNCECICGYDVGIAGIHRVFPIMKKIIENDVDAMVVIAGMDGALASVVSSLTNIPVIGVPTSIGYGYADRGISALSAMLQSCSLGLSVVNIDNGIGAGAMASNIANRRKRSDINYS